MSTPKHFPSVVFDCIVRTMQREVGDLLVHCVFELEGLLDAAQMKRAVRLSVDAAPVLGCRWVERGWRAPQWLRRDDLDEVSLCTLQETDDWEAARRDFLITTILPETDPLVQVLVIRIPSEQRDLLCIKLHHITADGGGLKHYVRMLCEIYRSLGQDEAYFPTPNLTGRRGLDQLLDCMSWRTLPARWWRFLVDTFRFWFFQPNWKFAGGPRGKAERRTYVFHHLDTAQVNHVRLVAKRLGGTVNDLVMAAFYRALSREHSPFFWVPRRVLSTVDLRRYLPGRQAETITNLSAFYYTALPNAPYGSLQESVRAFQEQMEGIKRCQIGLGETVAVIPMLRLLPYKIYGPLFGLGLRTIGALLPPVLTNMGHMSSEEYNLGSGCVITKGYLAASVIYPPHLGLAVSGFDQQLSITVGFCQTSFSTDEVQALLQQITDELLSEEA